LSIRGFIARQYVQALQVFNFQEIEKVLILLADCNTKSLGIGRADTDDDGLLRELAIKIMMPF
jgi:hypothetical protein